MSEQQKTPQGNSVWRLSCDTDKGIYKLTVELCQHLRAEEHEDVHKILRDMAVEWLKARAIDPSRCTVNVLFDGRRLIEDRCMYFRRSQEQAEQREEESQAE